MRCDGIGYFILSIFLATICSFSRCCYQIGCLMSCCAGATQTGFSNYVTLPPDSLFNCFCCIHSSIVPFPGVKDMPVSIPAVQLVPAISHSAMPSS